MRQERGIGAVSIPYDAITDLTRVGYDEGPLSEFFRGLSAEERDSMIQMAETLRAGPQANTPPGVILNVWVTKHVFGYRVRCKPYRSKTTGEIITAWDYLDGKVFAPDLGREINHWKPVLHYSVDYHCAFVLIQHLTRDGSGWERVEIVTPTVEGDPATVAIRARAGEAYDQAATGSTVPHAIAVAALKTVGIDLPAESLRARDAKAPVIPLRVTERYGREFVNQVDRTPVQAL